MWENPLHCYGSIEPWMDATSSIIKQHALHNLRSLMSIKWLPVHDKLACCFATKLINQIWHINNSPTRPLQRRVREAVIQRRTPSEWTRWRIRPFRGPIPINSEVRAKELSRRVEDQLKSWQEGVSRRVDKIRVAPKKSQAAEAAKSVIAVHIYSSVIRIDNEYWLLS